MDATWPAATFGTSHRGHTRHGEAISFESGDERHRGKRVGRAKECTDDAVSSPRAPPNL